LAITDSHGQKNELIAGSNAELRKWRISARFPICRDCRRNRLKADDGC
jgi:hypothetical protein